MPLANFSAEQIAPDRWVAELECGVKFVRRYTIRATSFEELQAAISAKYREIIPLPPAPEPETSPAQTAKERSLANLARANAARRAKKAQAAG